VITELRGSGSPGEDGAWTIEGVPVGRYTITIAGSGFVQQSYEEALEPAQVANVNVRLMSESQPAVVPPPGVPLEVTVRGGRLARESTKRTIDWREIARIPGTNGDVLRDNRGGVGWTSRRVRVKP